MKPNYEPKVIQQYQIELSGAEVDLSDTNQQRGRETHVYRSYFLIDRIFLLSNLAWHRARVTAGLTGRDPNANVNVLRRFR